MSQAEVLAAPRPADAPTLIGRDRDLENLLSALRAPDRSVVVLRGVAGSGKTRLTQAAVERLRRERVLVGVGKYGEGATQSPLTPIANALSELTDQALEELYDPQAGVVQMADALKLDLDVLVRAGFRGGGVQKSARLSDLAGRRAGTARLTNAAVKLLRWLSGFGLPMVLVLDDWWRAGEEAERLSRVLAAESADLPFRQLLLERGDQRSAEEIQHGRAVQLLGPLSANHSVELMRRCLDDDAAGDTVAGWFGEHAPRLPFEIAQTARALKESAALTRADGRWVLDDARAASLGRPALTLGIGRRIGALASDSRTLALAAALWGDAPPVAGLQSALALNAPRFAVAVRDLEGAGLVTRVGVAGLRFNHDRLREEVLRQASEAETRRVAAAMADQLVAASPAEAAGWSATALHLRCTAGLEEVQPADWRDRFAEGALVARRHADLDAAVRFAEAAWSLRGRAAGADLQADRKLIEEAVLAAADQQRPDAVLERVRLLIDSAPELEALGRAYSTGIVSLELAGEADRAWTLALEALRRFGVPVPRPVTRRHLVLAVVNWRLSRRLRRRSRDSAAADGLTRIGEAAATLAFERNPMEAGYIALSTSAKAGHSRRRAAFWASTDTFLSSMVGDYEAAARYGEIALARLSEAEDAQAALRYRALYFGVIWRQPTRSLRRFCPEIHDTAMAEGDLAAAGNALRNAVTLAWRVAPTLDEVKAEAENAKRGLLRLGEPVQDEADRFARIGRLRAVQDIFLLADSLTAAGGSGALTYRPLSPLMVLERANLLGDWLSAAREFDALRPQRAEFDNHPGGVDWRFHDCLAMYKSGRAPPRADIAFVRRHSRLNPGDHRAKIMILQAERLRLRSDKTCLAAYALAVEAADAGPSRLEAGLAARCAAEAAAEFRDLAAEQRYRLREEAIWKTWGAHALVAEARFERGAPPAEPPPEGFAERLLDAEATASAAERADRAKSRFLATVAHELRTPLQGMQSLLDLAGGRPDALELEQFREVFASLKTVVDDLTDFGALSEGVLPLSAAPLDLRALLESECAIARPLLNGAAVLELETSPTLPALINSDGPRLRQLVRNLLSNAVKYGGGSSVHMLATCTPGSTPDGVAVEIRVEDDGPGIAPEDLVRIFEPFERGGRTGDGQGLGLGLSVCRRIAESLGGRLVAMNREGGGACFSLHFEAGVARAPAEGRTDSTDVGPRGLDVLLAEDVAVTRRLIRRLLEQDGHRVVEAADGLEALDALRRSRFDLALLDMSMPHAGGADVLSEMDRRGDATPVMVLTAATGDAPLAAGVKGRVARVLHKPVSAAHLREAVDRVRAMSPPQDAEPGLPAEELDRLTREARREVERLSALMLARLDRGETGLAADAHRLAGLSYQFGWPDLGAAAEALEAAERHGAPSQTVADARFREAAAALA